VEQEAVQGEIVLQGVVAEEALIKQLEESQETGQAVVVVVASVSEGVEEQQPVK
jgi:hypothetical protein